MPSDLQRVAQGLVDCLNEIPRVIGALQQRAAICREHAALVVQLSGGSASNTAMQLDEAARRCEEAAHYLSMAPPKAHGWAQQMVDGIRTVGPTGGDTARRPDAPGGSGGPAERRLDKDQEKPEAAKPRENGSAGDDESPKGEAVPGRRISGDEGHRLQEELPRLEDSDVTRPKTRGTWVDENGDKEQLVSGQHDEWFQKATDFLRERGIPQRGSIMTPSHVETRFAMRMRVRGLKHETIMVNKVPCKGEWGCETILGHILPPGSTLTVFGPDGFKETYPLPTDDE